MNALRLLLALSVLGTSAVLGQTFTRGTPRPVAASTRLQLSATVDSVNARLGSPVVVKLLLRNISSGVIRVGDSSPDIDYEVTVTDNSGKELPRTAWGDKLLRGEYNILHSDQHDLEPGHELHAELDLSTIYELDRPGSYFIRAVFHAILPGPEEARSSAAVESRRPVEKAFSNPVQFTIVP